MNGPRLTVVSPRPPRADGQGDQRRAHAAVTALACDWTVEVVSWLPDAGHSLAGQWRRHPLACVRALALVTVRPVQVAYVQALMPRAVRAGRRHDRALVLYLTNRAAPWRLPRSYVIDFIDDLGGAAIQKGESSGALRGAFWRWEGRRLRRLDARLAAGATVSLAITARDAAAIGPTVGTIHGAVATMPLPDDGTKVAFTGNLFYRPNLDAALWICDQLVPRLEALGVDPNTVVVAGRRPPPVLRRHAARAGVDLRADVPDLTGVLAEAAVVICPVIYGSGVQNKVLDAVGAGRACVLTPFSNQALNLVDGESALVRERHPEGFADAIVALLGDGSRRRRLADHARPRLQSCSGPAVAAAWRESLQTARHRLSQET